MKHLLSIFLLLISISAFSQKETEVNTLENQFDKIYRTSTRYKPPGGKIYKVVNQDSFLKLKKDVLDSIIASEKIIADKITEISKQKETISSLNSDLDATKRNLENTASKENSISFFGLQLSKTTYNIILWSIIILLIIIAIFYMTKFRNSHVYTKEAKQNLNEVEEEFETFRKKTLIKEQKLRRQLQDEINKQK